MASTQAGGLNNWPRAAARSAHERGALHVCAGAPAGTRPPAAGAPSAARSASPLLTRHPWLLLPPPRRAWRARPPCACSCAPGAGSRTRARPAGRGGQQAQRGVMPSPHPRPRPWQLEALPSCVCSREELLTSPLLGPSPATPALRFFPCRPTLFCTPTAGPALRATPVRLARHPTQHI